MTGLNNGAVVNDCGACGTRILGPVTPPIENLDNICRVCTHAVSPEHDDFGCHVLDCKCPVSGHVAVSQIQSVLPNAGEPTEPVSVGHGWDGGVAPDQAAKGFKIPPKPDEKKNAAESPEDRCDRCPHTRKSHGGSTCGACAVGSRGTATHEFVLKGSPEGAVGRGENKNGVAICQACLQRAGNVEGKDTAVVGQVAHIVSHADSGHLEVYCGADACPCENANSHPERANAKGPPTQQEAQSAIAYCKAEEARGLTANKYFDWRDGVTYTRDQMERIARGERANGRMTGGGSFEADPCPKCGSRDAFLVDSNVKAGPGVKVTYECAGRVDPNTRKPVDTSKSFGVSCGHRYQGTLEARNAAPNFQAAIAAFEAHCKSCAKCGPVRNAPAGSDQADAKHLCPTGSQLLVADLQNGNPHDDRAKEDAGRMWDQAPDSQRRKIVDELGLGIGIIQFRWSQMPDSAKAKLLTEFFGLENADGDRFKCPKCGSGSMKGGQEAGSGERTCLDCGNAWKLENSKGPDCPCGYEFSAVAREEKCPHCGRPNPKPKPIDDVVQNADDKGPFDQPNPMGCNGCDDIKAPLNKHGYCKSCAAQQGPIENQNSSPVTAAAREAAGAARYGSAR